MMCLQVFYYWLFAKTINYYTSLNVLGITGGNIFFDKDGTFQWSSIAALVSFVAACLTFVGVFINVSTQKKIAQQQIDANLKAKARIEWINGVREKSSELISLLLSLQKEEIAFHEQWLKVEETSELLKLFFSSKTIKDIEKDIYVQNDNIFVSEKAKEILYNECNNNDKNIFVRRYIECLIELYENNKYKSYTKHRKIIAKKLNKDLFDQISLEFEDVDKMVEEKNRPEKTGKDLNEEKILEYESLKTSIPNYQSKLEEIDQSLQEYREVISEFSKIISYYLKIEWDKAKKGQ
ncbi:hypothetical protein [Enterococcus faecalis]|uniref:hypothetical protein n=1 Tax=Enterococcus faecalis TaxID=1351 RepID=UPI00032DF824|nr:hypothetical protein [Enterococcus faecalis]EGO2708547.1 hypothetical protein [Enterococcus faecalis]EOJ89980.1 hypothetical protein WOI_02458 [Enterococcus faecalis EnGen0368]ETU60688.1 hypothetical protein P026_02404 [Enterococcus faecalis EnGen0426]OSM24695.1 hypothetical protein B6S39_02020 [Enterococcus faecalis]OSM25028.1 hypothetical protein B6S41_10510 [Enterococcus faecalis]